ncbi:response regulator [Rhodobacteraceae bacterium 2CG4]|uniref:Response regulator n=1 Tax=Halovulum marinum TaxID=2662447 RepID=A0A6L5Z495_9RHOB|nr:response regulator transcription factor [Halovulum marinum]MSU91376.1 response regulator [Halovulum marinum]
MTETRVVIADDHPLYREGVARSLEQSGRYRVVGQAACGRDAVEMVEALRPQLVLLDLSMPDGGHWALTRIAGAPEAPLVAMLTVSEDDDAVLAALGAGAAGYILKGVGSRELVRILDDLTAGRSYVAPSLAAKVLTRMNAPRRGPAQASPLDTLTRREEDILRLVAEGKSNREVGLALDLREKTVKHYMTTILQKLQVRNRTEAALLAQTHWHGS